MSKFFLALYDYFHTHKKLLFTLMGTTLLLFLCFAIQIKPEEDLTSFFPKGKENEKRSLVFKNLKIKDKIFVMLSLRDTTANDPEKLIEAADHFTERLNNGVGETHINNITTGINDTMISVVTDYIYNNLPLFMTDEDYSEIDTLLAGNNLAERMEANYNNLISPV
ncbi:MAG: transporter, partial [Rikenellaceae bacterium]